MSIDNIILEAHHSAEVAAGTDADLTVTNPHPFRLQLEAAYLVPHAALTAHADNHTNITVKKGSTDVTTPVDTTPGSTGSLVAGTAVELSIEAAGEDLVLDQGESFIFGLADDGSGVAKTLGVALSCRKVR